MTAIAVKSRNQISRCFVQPANPDMMGVSREAPAPDHNAWVSVFSFFACCNFAAGFLQQREVFVETIQRKILLRWIAEEERLASVNSPHSDAAQIRIGQKHVTQLFKGGPVFVEFSYHHCLLGRV